MVKRFIFMLLIALLIANSCSKNKVDNPAETPDQPQPSQIALRASYPTLHPGGQATVIFATLHDTEGDTMGAGNIIRFEIVDAPAMVGPAGPSLNYIPSADSVLLVTESSTDAHGTAQSVLYPGAMVGDITIKASLAADDSLYTQQNLLKVAANQADHFIITAADPEIRIGFDSTTIRAAIVDNFDNPLGAGYLIRLEITAAPSIFGIESVSFSYPPNNDSLLHSIDLTSDQNGIVLAEIFSGIQRGVVELAASLINNQQISTVARPIRLLSGPPAHGSIGPSNYPFRNGDSVCCEITCLLWDEYANPCTDTATTIYFACIPDTLASIVSPVHADSLGYVITSLCYICSHSCDSVRVIFWTETLVDTSGIIVLPIFGPYIELIPNPAELIVNPGRTGTSEIWATLSDSLGCAIENGILIFSASGCGELYGGSIDTTNIDGFAFANFSISYDDIPPDTAGCLATVSCTIAGYPESRSTCEILCRRLQ